MPKNSTYGSRNYSERVFSRGEALCVALTLAAACLVTGALAIWLGLQQDYRTLAQRTQAIEREVAVRVASADAVLNSLTGMYRASDENRPHEFLDLSRELLSAYSFIRSISEAEVVRPENRAAWTNRMHDEGFPTVRIRTYAKQGNGEPSPATLFPIRLIEPLDPEFASLLGFDISSHPAIRPSLEQAIDSGKIGISKFFEFEDGHKGWVFTKAVYLGYVEPASPEERRRQIHGLIALHLRADALIGGIGLPFTDMDVSLHQQHEPVGVSLPETTATNKRPGFLLPTIKIRKTLDMNGSRYGIVAQFYPHWTLYKAALLAAFVAFSALIVLATAMAFGINRAHTRQTKADARRIQESEKRFRDYAEVSSDWYWSMDAELRFDYISQRLKSATGIDPAQLIGKGREIITPDDDPETSAEIQKNIDDMNARRSFRDFRYRSDRGSNGEAWFSVSGKPFYSETGEFLGYRGTARDITSEVKARMELFVAKESAERANQVKSEFLATMSHELRTPLNAILGFSEVIRDQLFGPVGNTRYREYGTDIHDSGEHLLALINDILDLSKIDSGKDEIHETVFALPDVVESARSLVQARADNNTIALAFDIRDDLPLLRADERRVKQVLVNLLVNAIKFSNPGGTVTIRAWHQPDAGFSLQVSDTGIGMAPEDIAIALSQFGRIENGLARNYEGTGLGLPLSKAIVEQHGGKLVLQSRIGIGTTVTVLLPESRIEKPSATIHSIAARKDRLAS